MIEQDGNKNEEIYQGLEMDEVNAPPFKMISLFIGLTVLGFLYVFLWVFLLTP